MFYLTDFSSDVSNKNLQVLPSPFYDAASQNWLSGENSTDSEELDSDSVYTASPWKSQLQMAGGTSSTNDTSLFITSVHPNVHALDHQPWLANEAPVSCMYLSEMSDYGGMPQPFTYQTLDDPGMKLMPYDTRFSTGHNRTGCEFSTAFPNGAFWSPVACASPRRGPILDTEQPQLRSQRLKWHRRRDITLNVSQDANKSTCLTHSVGTDAVLGCLRDIEEEFPKLLLAAGELPSSCDIIEMTSAVTGEGKSASCIIHSFTHSGYFYSTSSTPLLLRGPSDYSFDTVPELTRRSATGSCEWNCPRSPPNISNIVRISIYILMLHYQAFCIAPLQNISLLDFS